MSKILINAFFKGGVEAIVMNYEKLQNGDILLLKDIDDLSNETYDNKTVPQKYIRPFESLGGTQYIVRGKDEKIYPDIMADMDCRNNEYCFDPFVFDRWENSEDEDVYSWVLIKKDESKLLEPDNFRVSNQHGVWITRTNPKNHCYETKCSNCEDEIEYNQCGNYPNYCSNCGSDMRTEDSNGVFKM